MVVGRHLREGLQDVDRRHDQVVEVHGVGLAQTALVLHVDLTQQSLLVGGALPQPVAVGLLVDQLVLEVGDLVAERPRRVAPGVQVQVAHHHRHQALRVGRVVDREARRDADDLGLAAQDPDARRVEGGHPHGAGPAADDRLDPLAHLGGRLVGEGDRHDLAGLHVAGGEQVGDPLGEHAGLARPRARHDEQRRSLVQHPSRCCGLRPARIASGSWRGPPPPQAPRAWRSAYACSSSVGGASSSPGAGRPRAPTGERRRHPPRRSQEGRSGLASASSWQGSGAGRRRGSPSRGPAYGCAPTDPLGCGSC